MAELKFNTLYDQMSGANQDFYDDTFTQYYDPNQEWTNQKNVLTMKTLPDQSTPDFNAMQNAYNQAAQSKTANKFNWGSLLGMSSADAAMPTDAETAAIERSGINTLPGAQESPYADRIMDPDLMEQAQYRSMLERKPVNVPSMRLEGEPYFAEGWKSGDIFDRDTTLTGYQPFPEGDQFRNKNKYLGSTDYLSTLEPSLAGAQQDRRGFQFPSIMKGLGAIRDKLRPSPEEQFGASYFPQTDTGRVNYDPNQQLYGGMNVDTLFGEGAGAAGQKRIDRLQKTIDNYQQQWGHLSQDEYDVKLKRRQDQLKQFKTQQAAYGQALAAQNIQAQKDKAAADAPAAPTGQWQPTGRDYTPEQYSAIGRQHYTGPGMAFEARPSASGIGPKKEGGYIRPRYSNGGRVGILSVF